MNIRLTPKASRDGVEGLKEIGGKTYLQARVRAVPEDNRANTSLIELFAAQLKLPKSAITLASGHTSRLKTLHIAGDAVVLETRLAAWLKEME